MLFQCPNFLCENEVKESVEAWGGGKSKLAVKQSRIGKVWNDCRWALRAQMRFKVKNLRRLVSLITYFSEVIRAVAWRN